VEACEFVVGFRQHTFSLHGSGLRCRGWNKHNTGFRKFWWISWISWISILDQPSNICRNHMQETMGYT